LLWHGTLLSNSSEPEPYSQPGVVLNLEQHRGRLPYPFTQILGPNFPFISITCNFEFQTSPLWPASVESHETSLLTIRLASFRKPLRAANQT
jgi:hypothetical protein